MRNALLCYLSSTSFALAACGPAPKAADESGKVAASKAQSDAVAQPADGMTAPTVPPAGQGPAPVVEPSVAPPLTAEAERGEKGARNLLIGFARAIELGRYGDAWSMLGDADRKRWSQADFARMFADLPSRSVAVPEGVMEGAAGSLYYTAPVVITGSDRDGRPVRFEGEAVLRRVNDVDGASAEQLRWHFERLTLDWTH